MEKLLSGDFPFYRFRNLSAYPELMHFVSSGVKNIGFPIGKILRSYSIIAGAWRKLQDLR